MVPAARRRSGGCARSSGAERRARSASLDSGPGSQAWPTQRPDHVRFALCDDLFRDPPRPTDEAARIRVQRGGGCHVERARDRCLCGRRDALARTVGRGESGCLDYHVYRCAPDPGACSYRATGGRHARAQVCRRRSGSATPSHCGCSHQDTPSGARRRQRGPLLPIVRSRPARRTRLRLEPRHRGARRCWRRATGVRGVHRSQRRGRRVHDPRTRGARQPSAADDRRSTPPNRAATCCSWRGGGRERAADRGVGHTALTLAMLYWRPGDR